MIGIEPIVTKVGRFTVSCHTITAASPLYWSEYKDSNLGPPGPKPGALPDCATLRIILAPQTGIEPMTERLTAVCSTSELLRNVIRLDLRLEVTGLKLPYMVPFEGIPPSFTANDSAPATAMSCELTVDLSCELSVDVSGHKLWRSQGDSNPC